MGDTKFKVGQPKRGGRQKGTPNKKSWDASAMAEELGINPFKILLHFAAGNWKELGYDKAERPMSSGEGIYYVDVISPELRERAAEKASEYLLPKRKALELSNGEGGEGIFKVIIEDYSAKK